MVYSWKEIEFTQWHEFHDIETFIELTLSVMHWGPQSRGHLFRVTQKGSRREDMEARSSPWPFALPPKLVCPWGPTYLLGGVCILFPSLESLTTQNGCWQVVFGICVSLLLAKNRRTPNLRLANARQKLHSNWFCLLPLGFLCWPHGVFHPCPCVPDTSFLDDIHEAGRARRTSSTKPKQGGLFHQTWGIVWSDILNNIWNNRGIRRNKGRLVTPGSCLCPSADR